MSKNKRFYGYMVAAGAFLMMFTVGGLVNMTFSLYTVPVTESLGVTRSVFTLCSSIRSLMVCALSLAYSFLEARFGLKRLMIVGAAAIVASLLAFSYGANVWIFYLGGVLQGLGFSFTLSLPLSVLISNWFVKKRGTVLGFVYAASGFGGVLLSPVVGLMIDKWGWKTSFLLTAVVSAVVFIPALSLIKVKPSDIGQTALGEEQAGKKDIPVRSQAQAEGVMLADAVRTPSFWLMLTVLISFGFSINAAFINVAPHFRDAGFAPIYVSGVIMVIFYLSNMLAKIGMGIINDRLGVQAVNIIGGSASIVAFIMFLFSNSGSPVMAIVSVVFMGIGSSLLTVPIPLLADKLFGSRDFTAINGIALAVNTLATAIGSPLSNYTFDVTGSYSFAFQYHIVIAVVMILASGLAIKLRPYKKVKPVSEMLRQEIAATEV